MKPEEILSQMALDPEIAYLDHAAFSPLPKKTNELLQGLLKGKAQFGTLAPEFDILKMLQEDIPEGLQLISNLIGGDPNGIGFTRSTLQGIHTVVEGLPWQAGDSLIINDLEFTTNSFVHQVIAKKYGLDLRIVSNENGILKLEDFEKLIDEQTRIVALSYVQFSNGFRSPVSEIAKLVHEVGGYLLIDGIQAVGAMPINCKEEGIDALATGAYKWGMGPFMTGFLWVAETLREILVPSFVGWWSAEDPFQMSHHEFVPNKSGQHFEPSPSFTVLGMIESFDFLLNIGLSNVFSNILAATDHLVKRCEEADININSSLEPSHRSGIVNIGWPGMDAVEIWKQLKQELIAVSPREGGIRVSPHAYNTEEDIDRLINALEVLKRNTP
ncbi:MAG: aminotransferase class V-fold PLP-dependent enzyme [Promethearchaeota archaeon]